MSALFRSEESTDASGVTWSIGSEWEANYLLSQHHYLGPIAGGGYELITVGTIGDRLVAAQVWRNPTSRHLPPDGSWLELSRWCLTPDAGKNAGSRQHAASVRLIRRLLPKVTTLVSYSDPGHGHDGALYRACNWEWHPTWQRLRPPPTGNGAWTPGEPESVKDRWIFPLRRDPKRAAILAIDDRSAVAYWRTHATKQQRGWARTHPQLRETA